MNGAADLAALDALIEELTVDAYGDEEQLVGFLTGAEDALTVGETATVAGAEVRVGNIDCGPDARRGLLAVCERDRQLFELSLADPSFSARLQSSAGSSPPTGAGSAATRIPPSHRSLRSRAMGRSR